MERCLSRLASVAKSRTHGATGHRMLLVAEAAAAALQTLMLTPTPVRLRLSKRGVRRSWQQLQPWRRVGRVYFLRLACHLGFRGLCAQTRPTAWLQSAPKRRRSAHAKKPGMQSGKRARVPAAARRPLRTLVAGQGHGPVNGGETAMSGVEAMLSHWTAHALL